MPGHCSLRCTASVGKQIDMSSSYSAAERQLARLLATSPALKRCIKRVYQRINWLLHRRPHAASSSYAIGKAAAGLDGETYFGYYDKHPDNFSGTHLIFQRATGPTTRRPDPMRPIDVIVFDLQSCGITARLPTYAYNWQQGSKLQWLTDSRFVFNDYDQAANRFVARVYDLSTRSVVRTLSNPVYDCFGEDFALTLNYDRLARLSPDYGYFNRIDLGPSTTDLSKDGIFYMDMQHGQCQLLVSLEELARLHPVRSMDRAEHTVNHIMIAPDGHRFMAIHRWYQHGRRFDRLVLGTTRDTTASRVLIDGMVSHCFWLDPGRILGYLRAPGRGDGYWIIDVDTGDVSPLPLNALAGHGDGHPHVRGDWLITDTYPDKARMQHLLYCNWKTGETRKLGEFFHGFEYADETRCDLHPRLSADGSKVYFDSVFTGLRQHYCMDLRAPLSNSITHDALENGKALLR
jgi:hypothetical protein